jgi:hypothetical protein
MNLEVTKIDLAKKLLDINSESVLKQIEAILQKEEIVAYTTNGKPLTRTEYIDEIKVAEKDIEKGNYISHVQLLENIKKW